LPILNVNLIVTAYSCGLIFLGLDTSRWPAPS